MKELIKSYTDISQSKRLSEILPLESADMFYIAGKGEPIFIGNKMVACGEDDYDALGEPDVLCWSLAALLGALPFVDFTMPQLIGTPKTLYRCIYNDDLKSHAYDNPIDACYELIIKLNELKML